MNSTIHMDASGRLVLPKRIRERLNLRAGSVFHADIVAGHIELIPTEAGEPIAMRKKSGITVLSRRGVEADAASAVSAEREVQAERGRER